LGAIGCTPSVDGSSSQRGLTAIYEAGKLKLGTAFRDRQGQLDDEYNTTLANLLPELETSFQVEAAFLIDESTEVRDAIAVQESFIPNLPVASVIVTKGLYLQHREAEKTSSSLAGFPFFAICAHELAHVHQFNHGYRQMLIDAYPTKVGLELHAGMLAGWAISQSRPFQTIRTMEAGVKRDVMQVVVDAWGLLGDSNFNDESHHGTPEQRVTALWLGFNSAEEGTSLNTLASQGAGLIQDITTKV
jgi:hypothetical protein